MKTTIETTEGSALVTFEGSLDSYIAEEVEKDLEPVYELSNTDITLDCTRLEYIASNGLRLFLYLLQEVVPRGCKVSIKGANQFLMDLFEMTGFKRWFNFV